MTITWSKIKSSIIRYDFYIYLKAQTPFPLLLKSLNLCKDHTLTQKETVELLFQWSTAPTVILLGLKGGSIVEHILGIRLHPEPWKCKGLHVECSRPLRQTHLSLHCISQGELGLSVHQVRQCPPHKHRAWGDCHHWHQLYSVVSHSKKKTLVICVNLLKTKFCNIYLWIPAVPEITFE